LQRLRAQFNWHPKFHIDSGLSTHFLKKSFELNLKVKNFVLEIFDDEFAVVTYYTVRWDENRENETNKFVHRSEDIARKFRDARHFARTIWEAVRDKTIFIDESARRITFYDGTEQDILL